MQDSSVLSSINARFVRQMAPDSDDVLADIELVNRERGFPMVGPEVGGFLSVLATLVDARKVFEFGSGFGYSGYWFAKALPADGLVVLTEEDEDELESAREFFERGDLLDRAAFEAGDAHETFRKYEGPFDVVLIDHHKERYVEAFEEAKGKLAPGGVIVADNAMQAGDAFDLEPLCDFLDGDNPDLNAMAAGIAEYLQMVRSDPAFETVALSVGEGLAVSVKR